MEQFKDYFISSKLTDEKRAGFYISWLTRFYKSCNKNPDDPVTQTEIDRFLNHLSKCREEGQVKQASLAIQLHQYYKERKKTEKTKESLELNAQWKSVADEMRKVLRLMHRSYRTEQAYIGWVRQFYIFMKSTSPYSLESRNVKDFMIYLAVERNVAISTQNQAFNAILFLFRHVLDKRIDDISEAVRSKRKRRLPEVLTKSEIERLFAQMSGLHLLMAKVIYGCGLRLRECLQLRIKDIDFERNAVTIRSGKGDKDRETVLPESIKKNLLEHIERSRKIYEKDRKNNIPGVQLPYAFERKSPNAGKEWAWFWVFPSGTLSIDPSSRVVRRHHIHESNLIKGIKKAGIKAKIGKRITVHTLRHHADFRIMPTHLVESGASWAPLQFMSA